RFVVLHARYVMARGLEQCSSATEGPDIPMTTFNHHLLHPFLTSDLSNILQFVGECHMLTDSCGYHTGDVCHFFSNTLRGLPPELYTYLYEDVGQLLGLVLLYPPEYKAYSVLVHPHHRGGELEAGLLAWTEHELWARVQAQIPDANALS